MLKIFTVLYTLFCLVSLPLPENQLPHQAESGVQIAFKRAMSLFSSEPCQEKDSTLELLKAPPAERNLFHEIEALLSNFSIIYEKTQLCRGQDFLNLSILSAKHHPPTFTLGGYSQTEVQPIFDLKF